MTRDEAFTIIADALGPVPQQADIAHHIATALSHLGLLIYATTPNQLPLNPNRERIVPDDGQHHAPQQQPASATSNTPERSSPDHRLQDWANRRIRT